MRSRALLFLFDPAKDPRFRAACRGVSDDPQITGSGSAVVNQTPYLAEAAQRFRRAAGLDNHEPIDRLLVVVVTKSDIWDKLLPAVDLQSEPVRERNDSVKSGKTIPPAPAAASVNDDNFTFADDHAEGDDVDEPAAEKEKFPDAAKLLDLERIAKVSDALRELFSKFCPEIVSTAESCFTRVVFIPVSALGTGPRIDPDNHGLFVRTGDLCPRWVAVPLFYALAKA